MDGGLLCLVVIGVSVDNSHGQGRDFGRIYSVLHIVYVQTGIDSLKNALPDAIDGFIHMLGLYLLNPRNLFP